MKSPGDLTSAPDYALAFRTLEPVPQAPRRLLVLLHGVGGQELQLAALGARVDDDTLVVLPRAPRSIGEGMYGWFRVGFTSNGPQIVPEEAEDSRLQLIEFIGQLQQHYDVAASHTVVAGFSQGGILSASVALSAPQAVAGFGLLCGRILPELEPALASRDALATLDALIIHGRADDKLPVAWAERADGWLQRLGVPHRLQLHAAGHEFNPAMQADFLDWFGAARQRWNQ
jgi:phospholipase/carboxylesterase